MPGPNPVAITQNPSLDLQHLLFYGLFEKYLIITYKLKTVPGHLSLKVDPVVVFPLLQTFPFLCESAPEGQATNKEFPGGISRCFPGGKTLEGEAIPFSITNTYWYFSIKSHFCCISKYHQSWVWCISMPLEWIAFHSCFGQYSCCKAFKGRRRLSRSAAVPRGLTSLQLASRVIDSVLVASLVVVLLVLCL